MLVHNQYNIQPGTYQHWKNKKLYVVTDLVTHLEDPEQHIMVEQTDPLVVYRDLEWNYELIGNTRKMVQKTYARRLSEFNELMEGGVKRFRPV